MSGQVKFKISDDIAVLVIDNPPVNALSRSVLQQLSEALDEITAADAVKALVLGASGRSFPSGTDVFEAKVGAENVTLKEICNRLEKLTFPVVAAIQGTALGGGLELALAAHYRLAAEGARLGFPEITLGLSPNAGGTQRLPRVVGAQAALELLLSGRPVNAEQAAEFGLVDGVVEGDLPEAAQSYAQELATQGIAPRPSRHAARGFEDPLEYQAAIAAMREKFPSSKLAPSRLIDCVEAAQLLRFEIGLSYEAAAYDELKKSPTSLALRHITQAERQATRFPEVKGVSGRKLDHLGVAGSGPMSAAIAAALLLPGFPVTLFDPDEESSEQSKGRVAEILERAVARGQLGKGALSARMKRLRTTTDPEALSSVDLVIENMSETTEAKAEIFEILDLVLPPNAVLATNTASLDVDLLAARTSRRGSVLGLHFFPPANVMRLVEVVVGTDTAPDAVATALALARRAGKIPVRSSVSDGYIANRVMTSFRKAADELLEDGARVEQIDTAMRNLGFALGPYQVADLSGLDGDWAHRRRLARTRDPEERYVAIADLLCEAGRLGQKAGQGYYLYKDGSRIGAPDPVVDRIVVSERQRKGIKPREFSQSEIQSRCLLAMVNEGLHVVAEGVALRPSDIDVAMVHGFAFPRQRGGPMFWADKLGLERVRKLLRALEPEDPSLWRRAPLLDSLIKEKTSLADM